MASEIELVTGVVLLVFGLSYVLNAKYWTGPFKRLMAEPHQMLAVLFVSLVLGMIMVRGHNLWVLDWRALVTIIGWTTLLESILLLIRPTIMQRFAGWIETSTTTWVRAGGTIALLLGGLVTYLSWP